MPELNGYDISMDSGKLRPEEVCLEEENLMMALQLGIIDWVQYFELVKRCEMTA